MYTYTQTFYFPFLDRLEEKARVVADWYPFASVWNTNPFNSEFVVWPIYSQTMSSIYNFFLIFGMENVLFRSRNERLCGYSLSIFSFILLFRGCSDRDRLWRVWFFSLSLRLFLFLHVFIFETTLSDEKHNDTKKGDTNTLTLSEWNEKEK